MSARKPFGSILQRVIAIQSGEAARNLVLLREILGFQLLSARSWRHRHHERSSPTAVPGRLDSDRQDLDHLKSRDEIPAVLKGREHIWSDEALRVRLLSLLEEHILPEAGRTLGRPGMDLWQILVLGVLKQGLGCDSTVSTTFRTITRRYVRSWATAISGDKTRYEYQTVVDNVSLLTPELLSVVGQLVVESGHKVAKGWSGEPLRGRCDSLVVETAYITRRTSTCCGTRCVACCGRPGGQRCKPRSAGGASGGICRGRSGNCSTGCARRGGRSAVWSGWKRIWGALPRTGGAGG